MRRASLGQIAPLVAVLRRHPALEEVRPLTFHLHGRDFSHFHDDPGGVAADVRLAKRVVRDSLARSRMAIQLSAIHALGPLSPGELERFTQETRDTVEALARSLFSLVRGLLALLLNRRLVARSLVTRALLRPRAPRCISSSSNSSGRA